MHNKITLIFCKFYTIKKLPEIRRVFKKEIRFIYVDFFDNIPLAIPTTAPTPAPISKQITTSTAII